jgi:hypothetical protein
MNITLKGMTKMKNRTELLAADLYVLLQREFRRRQDPACKTCFMQLPFRVDRPERGSPNWEVILPPNCERGCQELILELAGEFGALYDLRPDHDREMQS